LADEPKQDALLKPGVERCIFTVQALKTPKFEVSPDASPSMP
jgi:hypothetical protein